MRNSTFRVKRIAAVLLAVCTAVAATPFNAFAAAEGASDGTYESEAGTESASVEAMMQDIGTVSVSPSISLTGVIPQVKTDSEGKLTGATSISGEMQAVFRESDIIGTLYDTYKQWISFIHDSQGYTLRNGTGAASETSMPVAVKVALPDGVTVSTEDGAVSTFTSNTNLFMFAKGTDSTIPYEIDSSGKRITFFINFAELNQGDVSGVYLKQILNNYKADGDFGFSIRYNGTADQGMDLSSLKIIISNDAKVINVGQTSGYTLNVAANTTSSSSLLTDGSTVPTSSPEPAPTAAPTPTPSPTPVTTPTPSPTASPSAPTPSATPAPKQNGTNKTTRTTAPDGTAVGAGAETSFATAQIVTGTGDEGPSGTSYGKLQLKLKKAAKKSISLKWNRAAGATRYLVFGAKCGSRFVKIGETTGTSYKQNGLKKGTYYKYLILAVNGDTVVSASKTVHAATTGGKYTNVKTVKTAKKTLTVKRGKSVKIKKVRTTVFQRSKRNKKHRGIRYESSDTAVATVRGSGKVTGVKKGTCYIYVYAQDGAAAKVKIKVK